jgi:ADP-dependent NAD(P)H-hydrate dehydratase / NAD(P)H-hydrate epimerase
VTLSIGGPKLGLLLAPGAQHAGEVHVGRLGPLRTRVAPRRRSRIALASADAATVPARGRSTRPGTSATVASCSSSPAGAAARVRRRSPGWARSPAGQGLVTVAVPAVGAQRGRRTPPGPDGHRVAGGRDGALHRDAVHALDAIAGPGLAGFDAVIAGPGLGTGAGAAAVVAHLRMHAARLVLDADALNVHRDAPETAR